MPRGLTAARFPFVSILSEGARRELGALPAARVGRGQRLLTRGDLVQGAYFVVEGRLRVYYITPEGREATLYRVDPGETCILAVTAHFGDGVYPAWVDAGSSGATFVRVPRDLFHRLCDREPSLRAFVFAALAGRVFELMRTLEEVGSARVGQRLARYLIRNADVDGIIHQSQAGIAADLGTAREVVSRAMRALAHRGMVRTTRSQVRIVKPRSLAAVGDAERDVT